MLRVLKIAESLPVLVLAILALLTTGIANYLLLQTAEASTPVATWLTNSSLYTLVQAAYYIIALRILTSTTPRLLGQIRPAVNIDDQQFARFARRIAGGRTRHIFTLVGPVLALFWISITVAMLFDSTQQAARNLHSLMSTPLASIAILFSLVSLWRMWHLMQLARQPLHISLFDYSVAMPIGGLSSLYSVLIMCGEMLHLFLFGAPNLAALAITGFSTLSSIIALLLPLWAVHVQMKALKVAALNVVNTRIAKHLHNFLEAGEPQTNGEGIPALHNLRTIILSAPTWPITTIVSTTRALIVPFLPIIYVLAQQLLVPYFNLFLKSVGLSSE